MMADNSSKEMILTLDIDWAPDFIIKEVADKLIAANVKATWFVTHDSPAIDELRSRPELFELGIHPNFRQSSTHGDTEDEVMRHMKDIVPEAVTMRPHGLHQNMALLIKAAKEYNIQIDASIFLPYVQGIEPNQFRWTEGISLLRVPLFWEDDYEFHDKDPSWDITDEKYRVPGLKVFNFHPMHIALNSPSDTAYNELKKEVSIQKCTAEDIAKYKNPGRGAETLFKELIEELSKGSLQIKELL